MIGRQAGRNPLQLVVGAHLAEGLDEAGLLERRPHAVRVVDDLLAERVERRLLGHPHPAAGVHLAGLEVEVAAVRVGAPSWGEPPADPREARPDVGLVRRLVLAEAGVAVDPEDRALRVGLERDAARLEALGERGDERLQRLLEEPLVIGLARLEPGPVVVRGEVGEELDRFGGEAAERRRRDGHRKLLGAAAGT